jgi:signal peptidase II
MIAWARMVAALGATVLVDQGTKAIVVASIDRGERINVFFGVDLVQVRNKGVAFGAFQGAGLPIAAIAGAALVALVVYFALNTSRPWLWLPVGAVLGGAISNLADRAREGAVIDFIDVIAWPAFNLADVAIVLGVLGLLYVLEGPRR